MCNNLKKFMKLLEFLEKLDLNLYEREVIVYLSSVDVADAKLIYDSVKVPQGRIYSVLQDLRKKGFIEVIPTSPKKYQIKDIKKSLKRFLKNEQLELKDKLDNLSKLKIELKTKTLKENPPSVNFFTGKVEHIDAIASLRDNAKKELLQIAPRFEGNFASMISLKRALKRKVKVNIIILRITDGNKKQIKAGLESGAEIRSLDYPPDHELLSFVIKDSSEFLAVIQDYQKKEKRMAIFSRNKPMLSILKDSFDKYWKEAKSISMKDLK